MIFWKGKGILIFIYFIGTAVILAIANWWLIESFGMISPTFEVFMGIVLMGTGIWTKLTAKNYFIDKEGKKVYLDIENELFFISMDMWGAILLFLGAGFTLWGLIMVS